MRQSVVWSAAAVLAALAGPAWAQADEDLKVVKKAVVEKASVPGVSTGARKEPMWFKVKIVDKGAKRSRVTINLPLGLVRSLGDDFPIDLGECHWLRKRDRDRDRDCPKIHLSEVLRTLEAGQDLVQIEDDEATVRIWVE